MLVSLSLYHNDMPFAPFEQPQQPEQYVPPTQGYQAGPQAGASAGRAINDAWNLITVIGSYKAGRNHYEQSGDLGKAAAAGAGIFVRFNVWLLVWLMWMMSCIMGPFGNEAQNPNVTTLLCVAIAPFCLGVTWCRNGDYGLFKRGPVYKLFAPIARMVEPIPTGVLYALILIPMFV